MKTWLGYVLLAAGAIGGFLWWRSRSTAGTGTASTTGQIGQVGSNINQDVSADTVKIALKYAEKVATDNGPCWLNLGPDPQYHLGQTLWQRSDNPALIQYLPTGISPSTLHIC